jgi:hypothetical protein
MLAGFRALTHQIQNTPCGNVRRQRIRGSLKSLAVQRERVIQLSLSHQLLTLLNELGLLLLAAWSLREYTRDRN